MLLHVCGLKYSPFAEPQNGWGWNGLLEVICSSPTAQAGPSRASCPVSCPGGFWVSPRWQTP